MVGYRAPGSGAAILLVWQNSRERPCACTEDQTSRSEFRLLLRFVDQDGTSVGELLEPVPSMVGSDPAFADAPEGEQWGVVVIDGGVDADPSGPCPIQHVLHRLFVLAEHVQRQGRCANFTDHLEGIAGGRHRDDGKDWAEYFLLHHRVGQRRGDDDGRGDEPLLHIDLVGSACYHFTLGCPQEVEEAVDVSLTDHTSVVRAPFREHLLHGARQPLYHCLGLVTMDNHVVRCDARLPAVEPFTHSNALHRLFHRCSLVDDDRRLSPKFQGDRGEVLRGGSHDLPPDGTVACVQNVIPTLLQKSLRLWNPAQHHPHATRVHVLSDKLADALRAVGGDLTGLDDHAVPRGDHSSERCHDQ
eukprot:Sspe_Gene.35308::Locus_17115_Transcript_1_1_Confidence_1.000_Length_1573::g.35308::m.35308